MLATNFKIFFQLLARDFFVFSKRIKSYGINYLIIYPLLCIITFGYIQPGVYFGPGNAKASIILLVGMFCINMLSFCYTLMSPFVFDLEAERFTDYQITILPPRWLLAELILFPGLLAAIISVPFFPLAYAILPSYFNELNTNWTALLLVVISASLYCSSYIMMALCMTKKATSIRQFWLRFNWPLVVIGGLWIPWHLLEIHMPWLAKIALLDPFTYFTEGIRSSLIGSPQFINHYWCIIALLVSFCIFSIVASYFFKKKMDHV